MNQRKLSRYQAWTRIRSAFNRFPEDLRVSNDRDRIIFFGLCYAVKTLRREDKITWQTVDLMRIDIERMKPPGNPNAYYWTCNFDGAAKRVAAIDRLLKRLKKNVTRRRKS